MKKQTLYLTLTSTLLLFSSFKVPVSSNGPEKISERQMLAGIEYVEDEEEIILDFDPYLYLPFGFNAYEGMRLDINDIDYIDIDEEVLFDL